MSSHLNITKNGATKKLVQCLSNLTCPYSLTVTQESRKRGTRIWTCSSRKSSHGWSTNLKRLLTSLTQRKLAPTNTCRVISHSCKAQLRITLALWCARCSTPLKIRKWPSNFCLTELNSNAMSFLLRSWWKKQTEIRKSFLTQWCTHKNLPKKISLNQ